MKALVFDASSIITLSMNGLLDYLRLLKKEYKGKFFIPKSVKKEVVDKPLNTKRFKLEGLRVLDTIKDGYIEIYYNKKIDKLTKELLYLSNHIYQAHGNWIRILQEGEIGALALCLYLNADAFVVDERTMRMLIEEPDNLAELLSKKLRTKISVNDKNLSKFKAISNEVKIIRSVELMSVAFEKGMLDKYSARVGKKLSDKNLRRELLDGLLWGLKLRGCAISVDEINKMTRLEGL